jgi:hypothetical protein
MTPNGLSYFGGRRWSDITREERLFCAELYQVVKVHPRGFVRLVNAVTSLDLKEDTYWDVGYEVCFYRDVLDHRGEPKGGSTYSLKRTFDLCMFSEDAIVVIEAKSHQLFTAQQSESFAEDAGAIARLIGAHPKVFMIALASSRYFQAFDAHGGGIALRPFDARLSWSQLEAEYANPLFGRAEAVYRAARASIGCDEGRSQVSRDVADARAELAAGKAQPSDVNSLMREAES